MSTRIPERPVLLRSNVSLTFSTLTITGELLSYPNQRALVLVDPQDNDTSHLSTNLEAYGLHAPEGSIFIKDWSENAGVTAQLVAQGLVEIESTHTVGPFNLTAYQVRLCV